MLLTNRGQGQYELSNNGFRFENVKDKLPCQLVVCRNERVHVGLLHQSKVASESGAPEHLTERKQSSVVRSVGLAA